MSTKKISFLERMIVSKITVMLGIIRQFFYIPLLLYIIFFKIFFKKKGDEENDF